MKRLWTFFVFLSLLPAADIPDHYIVELTGDPVAVRLARQPRLGGMRSEAARQMRTTVRAEREGTRRLVEQEQATVLDGVDTVANALIVRIPDARAGRLARLAGVKSVRPVREFKLLLDRAVVLHGLPAAWAQIGPENAGAGVRIGIIDTGIDANHPGFRDGSLSPPQGFPKVNAESDLSFTNSKIIVARSYASLFSRRETDSSARDRVGHGTAAAMAAAGVTISAPLATISGMAPKAFLGNYKVFGTPGVNDGASEAAIMKAIDDAVADGMDIINLSLGLDVAPRLDQDPLVQAVERASSLGVIVVVAAGNNGPDLNTISSPATAPSVIAVGASSNDRIFAPSVVVDGATYVAIPGSGPAPVTGVSGTLADIASLDGTGLACSDLPGGSLTGQIALILRGTCYFDQKLLNAQRAGARAAVVYSNAASPEPFVMGVGAATLPAEMVSYPAGLEIKQQLGFGATVPVTMRFTTGPVAVNPDKLAGFSVRGPGIDNNIKPDLVAVGTSVYTATQSFDTRGDMYQSSGYIDVDGTSFSSPIVAGAAALIKAARPGLTAAQYRSLLINSATPISSIPGAAARVQEAGAGLLNAYAALRSPVVFSQTAVNFGAGRLSPNLSRSITLTNISGVTDTFSISAVPRDPGIFPIVSSSTLELAPGASADLSVRLTGAALDAGPYEGYLSVRGSSSEVEARIPYWYAASNGTPSHITLLSTTESARRSSNVRSAVMFRVTDASGVALPDVTPDVFALSGDGEVTSIVSLDESSPGVFRLSVRLGALAGANTFRIQIGGAKRDITITGT